MNKKELLKSDQHRPFPLPKSPWVMQQTWEDLLFLHYKVPYEVLREAVPADLEIDSYDDEYWISISPFRMKDVRFRWLPPIPTAYNFLELNLRTYVRYNGREGIYFFSLDASSTLGAIGGRAAFLPYFTASMLMKQGAFFYFRSDRKGAEKAPAHFEVYYKPVSKPFISEEGSLNAWLVERYCLLQQASDSKVIEIDIHHLPWQLQNAEADVRQNSLTEPFGFSVPGQDPIIHYAKSQKVLVWPLRLV